MLHVHYASHMPRPDLDSFFCPSKLFCQRKRAPALEWTHLGRGASKNMRASGRPAARRPRPHPRPPAPKPKSPCACSHLYMRRSNGSNTKQKRSRVPKHVQWHARIPSVTSSDGERAQRSLCRTAHPTDGSVPILPRCFFKIALCAPNRARQHKPYNMCLFDALLRVRTSVRHFKRRDPRAIIKHARATPWHVYNNECWRMSGCARPIRLQHKRQ